jgi:hypothetical protein
MICGDVYRSESSQLRENSQLCLNRILHKLFTLIYTNLH